jgi:hypothetical protein
VYKSFSPAPPLQKPLEKEKVELCRRNGTVPQKINRRS